MKRPESIVLALIGDVASPIPHLLETILQSIEGLRCRSAHLGILNEHILNLNLGDSVTCVVELMAVPFRELAHDGLSNFSCNVKLCDDGFIYDYKLLELKEASALNRGAPYVRIIPCEGEWSFTDSENNTSPFLGHHLSALLHQSGRGYCAQWARAELTGVYAMCMLVGEQKVIIGWQACLGNSPCFTSTPKTKWMMVRSLL